MMKSTVMCVLLAMSFSFVNPCSQSAKKYEGKQPTEKDKIFNVNVVYPEFITLTRAHNVEGELEDSEVNFVTANFSGDVEAVLVNVGDTVKVDDPVATLSSEALEDEIDLKRAKIREYTARLDAARNRLSAASSPEQPVTQEEVAFLDEEPVVPITGPVTVNDPNAVPITGPVPANGNVPMTTTTTTQVVTQKPLGAAEEIRSPQTLRDLVAVLDGSIERLTAEVDVFDKKLLDLDHKSPVTGVVVDVPVTAGNSVREQDKLVAIAKTDPMSVVFHLPQDVASFVDKTSGVTVSPVDAPDVQEKGTVYFISPDLDPVNKTIEMRAHVANPDGRLKGGQKMKVAVSTRRTDRILVVPTNAVVHEGDEDFLFVVYGSQARMVNVDVGSALEDGRVEIQGVAIRVDDPIVVDRPLELKNNSFVKILEGEPAVAPMTKGNTDKSNAGVTP